MQLRTRKSRARLTVALGLMTANLFLAAGVARAQSDPSASDDGGDQTGSTSVDSAVLVYQEAGGRVQAIEPVANMVLTGDDGESLSLKLTSDTLTGATPNGAAPWKAPQTFITPAHAPGSQATVTTASGGSTIVTIPGTGLAERQYTTPANTLPVDAGFRDQRYAIDLGYSMPVTENAQLSAGAGYSTERDYTSYTANTGVSQDLFHKNTTLSLAVNGEFDVSRPYFGTPTPFTQMSAQQKGSNQTKYIVSAVVGITQVMDRYWLTQLNYDIGTTNGYQTDPYKIISVVDASSGAPLQYLYESRPNTRLRQSLYWGNKIALGPTVADVSVRGYRDSWGIRSLTVDVSERVPLRSWLYVEPEARYYKQTAASFYRPYLLGGQPLPAYASADSRLSDFSAVTYGVRIGLKLTDSSEVYLLGEDYVQSAGSDPNATVKALSGEPLFGGVNAVSVMVGFKMSFQ